MKLPPTQLCMVILSLHNLYGKHDTRCAIINRMILIAISIWLTRTEFQPGHVQSLILDLHGFIKIGHPYQHKYILHVYVECKQNLTGKMKYVSKWWHGFVIKSYSIVDFSNLPADIYILILKGYPYHSLGLIMLSNRERLSQLVTTVATRNHRAIHFTSSRILPAFLYIV